MRDARVPTYLGTVVEVGEIPADSMGLRSACGWIKVKWDEAYGSYHYPFNVWSRLIELAP
ncbi:MAG: hypothetical protein Q8Q14_07340 [Gemmatimonadales bacterium]|nr:hypothetical protein [Gemmatimonadales bacterium]